MPLKVASSLPIVLVLWALWSACGGAAEPEIDTAEPTSYAVRGVVRQIRELGDGKTQLSVFHEAIDEFIGITGEVVGMKSMTMPFTMEEGVDLTGIEPGSKVRFELSVDWDRAEPGLISAVELLPEGTVLDIGRSD